MSKVKFKDGDLVYCPDIDNRVHTLESYDKNLAIYYNRRDNCEVFYFDGTSRKSYAPRIFHATQENYELLSKLYPNIAFEPPPKRKEPKEIIKVMLESGWYRVPVVADGCLYFVNSTINHISRNWDNVYPFDPKTGKTIIDFVDGEVVLEGENDE